MPSVRRRTFTSLAPQFALVRSQPTAPKLWAREERFNLEAIGTQCNFRQDSDGSKTMPSRLKNCWVRFVRRVISENNGSYRVPTKSLTFGALHVLYNGNERFRD